MRSAGGGGGLETEFGQKLMLSADIMTYRQLNEEFKESYC